MAARVGLRKKLRAAISEGNLNQVRKIIETIQRNADHVGGLFLLLHLASKDCHLAICKLLLTCGRDANFNRIALHLATKYGNRQMVELLLHNGANVNEATLDGTTPLHTAIENCHEDIAKKLLSRGADVNATKKDGTTPLILTLRYASYMSDFIESLVRKVANVNAKREDGTTALHLAVLFGRHNNVRYLLESHADVNASDARGLTALHHASVCSIHDNIKILIEEYNADINTEDIRNGATPVSSAPCCNQVLQYLSEHVVKLRAANLYVSPTQCLNLPEDRLYFDRCTSEIKKMRATKVCNISLYDVLAKSVNKLADYARNEAVVRVLRSTDYEAKFPLYANLLKHKVSIGEKRRDVLDSGVVPLRTLLGFKLPIYVVQAILKFLSAHDINNMVAASELSV